MMIVRPCVPRNESLLIVRLRINHRDPLECGIARNFLAAPSKIKNSMETAVRRNGTEIFPAALAENCSASTQ